MRRVLVLGAGRVGRAVAHLLAAEGGYAVTVGDPDGEAARRVASEVAAAGVADAGLGTQEGLARALEGQEAVVSAAPRAANPAIARAARRADVHYLDVTEDSAIAQRIRDEGRGASRAVVPQCGLAPGFVALAAARLVERLGDVEVLVLRVGALPRAPANRLGYNLTWSTEGLVNEYTMPCEALREGRRTEVPPLAEQEEFVLDGRPYEAFTTSGGAGSLCRTYEGRIRHLDYKTIRYPGHGHLIRFLLEDLGFAARPGELVALLERTIPPTRDDVVLISLRARGRSGAEAEWSRTLGGAEVAGHRLTALEATTAAGVCGVLHVVLAAEPPPSGPLAVEEIGYARFMASPFGRYLGGR